MVDISSKYTVFKLCEIYLVNDDSGSCLDSDHLSCLSHSEFRQVIVALVVTRVFICHDVPLNSEGQLYHIFP